MKRPLALISLGILLLLLALGSWGLSRTQAEAGNAEIFEQALNPAGAPETPARAPVPDEPAPESADDPAPAFPRFTIARDVLEADNRIPVALRIPSLGEEAEIIPAGVAANGDMEVPDNVRDVAWYKYGSAPGEPGSAVLAAHVDLAGRGPGVFFDLRTLDPGSVIYVEFDDGTSAAYVARARAVYDKDELPTDAIFSRQGPPVLTLITCGGDFNPSIRRYDSNVVVYAVPIDNVKLPIT